jgi:hypothetical protein
MDYLTTALREHQELAVFLTLAIGFFIGRVKLGSFSLGTVVGTLLAGVLIGQLNIQVPVVVKYVFFDLFLFTTGYKVGPQFFRGLKGDALPRSPSPWCSASPVCSPRSSRRNSSAMTWARPPACSPGHSPNPRSSAPPAMPSAASPSRPRTKRS